MKYRFKPLQELYWAVLVAGATVLLLELAGLNPDAITDWRGWAVALGAGMVRAMAAAAIDYLRRSLTDSEEEEEVSLADEILSLSIDERTALLEELERRQPVPPPMDRPGNVSI